MERKSENGELELPDLLELVLKNKILISIFAIVFATAFFVKAVYFTDYTYTASGVLYISNKNIETKKNSKDDEISKTDIDSARTLTDTCIEILKTRDFLEEVSLTAGEDKDWKEIYDMLSVNSLNNTELIEASVTADSPQCAYNIAKSVIEKAPEKLTSVYNSGDVEVVNSVYYPTAPNSKRIAVNTFLGLGVGLILGCVIMYIRYVTDKKIRDARSISALYGVSILGEVKINGG